MDKNEQRGAKEGDAMKDCGCEDCGCGEGGEPKGCQCGLCEKLRDRVMELEAERAALKARIKGLEGHEHCYPGCRTLRSAR